ncbi:hypothetical protein I8Y03_002746 [Aeromonas hydrophila]|nr:hypothetical protein [Aeromonas hydrophila]
MYWPDTGTGVDTEPARKPVASAVRKYFTEGGAGVPPTVPGGDWFNAITNEVLNVLDAAGIDPSKTDDDQLLLAIPIVAENAFSSSYIKLPIKKNGTFLDGGEATSYQSALLASDNYYYMPRSGSITALPGSSPDSLWVCVGLLNGQSIDDMRNWLDGRPHLDAFVAARDSKSIRGGGVVTFPEGNYTFSDEFVLVDYVKFIGEDRIKCRVFGAAGAGSGKAVVRACKSPVGSSDIPEYLAFSGFSNCTIDGNGTWDVGLYVRHCTNESNFDDVTAQSCKKANSIFIGSFYISAKDHVARDARDLGAVIGKKLFSEGGLNEVNASAFNNLRGNYAGLDDAYHPTSNPYAGACVTIWSANSCAFDYVGGENAFGAGIVIRKGINSYIPSIYVEANGRGTLAVDNIGMRVIDADFPSLNIGSVDATREQKIFLEGNSLLSVGEIYSESFADGVFLGTGKVLLMNGRSVNNFISSDQAFIENIETKRLAQFGNIPFTNFSSLGAAAVIFGESLLDVQVVLVPRVTLTVSDPILIGLSNGLSGGTELNFGTSFTAGTPLSRRFASVNKGAGLLTHRSNSLPAAATNLAFDIFVIQYVCDYRVVFNRTFS